MSGVDGAAPKRVTVVSNLETWHGDASTATAQIHLSLCAPARGFTEIRVWTPAVSEIPPSLRSADLANASGRRGGIFLSEIALADEIGPRCTPTDSSS
jgi:hypothetical protein